MFPLILFLSKLSNNLVDIPLVEIFTTRGSGGTTVDPSSKSFHLYDNFDTPTSSPCLLVDEIGCILLVPI